MTDPSEVFSGPGVTALGLAASRTVESGRPDRLIDDQVARIFFEVAGVNLPMRLEWPHASETLTDTERLHLHGSRYIGLRTRVYDDLLLRAADRGVRQGLLIGAGLDTRAFRLQLPAEFHLIELDQMRLLAWKQSVLEEHAITPKCRRSWISTDLTEDWVPDLARCSFNSGQPTVFIAEGLLPYLNPQQQEALLDRVDKLGSGDSVLAFDRIFGDPHDAGRAARLSRQSGLDMTRLFASGENDGIAARLRDRGWTVRETAVAEIAAVYGRDLTNPFEANTNATVEPPWLETSFLQGTR